MLAYIIGVVLFALGICVSVALHEAGHMLTAKAFGMKVRRYFVGFGPTVFSWRRGETEYGLKWIPLGGFCDIAGMTALDEVTPDEAPRAMWRFKTWKRTVVMSAGSITHFILGFVVLYLMAVTMGLPNLAPVDTTPVLAATSCAQSATTEAQAQAQSDDPSCPPGAVRPAEAAGLRAGDKILAVGGKPVASWTEMLAAVQATSGRTQFDVQRGDQRLALIVDVPQVQRWTSAGVKTVGMIGASPKQPAVTTQYGPVAAVGATFSFTGTMFAETAQRLVEFPQRIPAVVTAIFGGERDPNTPVSVVGASRIGGEAVERGIWVLFFFLLASLNFFIGVFNLLPLLPLDGGHIAVVWYERVRDWIRARRGKVAGGPVDYTRLSGITMVLVLIGGAVTLLTVTADIVNPIRLQ
ncbi:MULTISPECIES: site-2 protease family protein [unclassified Amycolatopsis]|uniref:M50 family metallopeptidase n=1 Tax=unclassified Amycolatopsis TaxID=2618356 RepID=UPI002876912C|nr:MULTISPECIES: site-2 protease family protein [unclassified Amycolatopsis]MDS0137893.1 site-2 protease family protein [Amycolatopsis sp. 505]MDS0144194.1 site-2 protease family protein [Amycolatopsis sp. CM201R]